MALDGAAFTSWAISRGETSKRSLPRNPYSRIDLPKRSPVGVIIELPEMYKLIDRAGIALEVTDKFLVLPALLERREPYLLIEFHRLGHLADIQRVGSQFV